MTPIIKPAAEWNYLAGADPTDDWTSIDFSSVQDWKSGRAGFGYGDGDDKTVLSKMKGSYQRVYLRREFDSKDASSASKMVLAVNYDDAFIAYLNGKEVLREGVEGAGKAGKVSELHEAEGFDYFALKGWQAALKEGGENPLDLPPAHWPENHTGRGTLPEELESWRRFWGQA